MIDAGVDRRKHCAVYEGRCSQVLGGTWVKAGGVLTPSLAPHGMMHACIAACVLHKQQLGGHQSSTPSIPHLATLPPCLPPFLPSLLSSAASCPPPCVCSMHTGALACRAQPGIRCTPGDHRALLAAFDCWQCFCLTHVSQPETRAVQDKHLECWLPLGQHSRTQRT